MPNIGLPELFLLPLLVIYVGLPIASFILVLLTYRKVKALEQRLAEAAFRPSG